MVNLVNSLLHDNGTAAIEVASSASLVAFNNTIAANDVGIDIGNATVTLVNNLIANNTTTGVEADGSATLTIQYNDVFNPGGTNYSGIPDPTGSNGNISVDPGFQGPHFGLSNDSPVIDAGTSNGAPEVDFLDHVRSDHPNVANTGGGAQPWYDMGALERFCNEDGVDGLCEILGDGFESGDTRRWSNTVP